MGRRNTAVFGIAVLPLCLAIACSDAADVDATPPGGSQVLDVSFGPGGLADANGDSDGGTSTATDGDNRFVDSGGAMSDLGTPPDPEPCEFDGAWGCPCKNADECNSGFCLEGSDGKVCTKTCTDWCPSGWQCQQAGDNDATFICVPKFALLCRPCATHGDCNAQTAGQAVAKCLPNAKPGEDFVDGLFCGYPCQADAECPLDYGCSTIELPDEATTSQCVPKTGGCTCSKLAVALKMSTPCWRANEHGKCTGQRTCMLDGLTSCDVPAPAAEVCDGKDNDCDGQTDEKGALGCQVWYPDGDGDGTGVSLGQCTCAKPGPGYVLQGGDCNDANTSIQPGAMELCNQLDDDCDGQTDESGAKGCTNFFADKDGDSFGDPATAVCLCNSKKPAGHVDQAGDCDDADKSIKPGGTELCDGQDNNCNDKIDEEDAKGCTKYHHDVDGDGFGDPLQIKCLCKPAGQYTATKAGDCDDGASGVYPGKLETCNGVDDDCNGSTDDGDADKSCPPVSKGKSACSKGKCVVGDCVPGYFNIDETIKGCECKADSNYGKIGATCKAATDVGAMTDAGQVSKVSGNVMPGEDGDWYRFKAIDKPEQEGGCDTFHVRVRFLYPPPKVNPFVFDLYRGSCAGQGQVCQGHVDGSWTVRFSGKPFGAFAKKGQVLGKKKPSPKPLPAGECKCSNKTAGKGSGPGAPGLNFCSDNSADFFVRVRLKAGAKPTCENYKIELSNGLYKP